MNILSILKKHKTWSLVKQIQEKLNQNNYQVFLAGGCVRDALLGIEPKDLDLVCNAPFKELEKLFPQALEVGKSFGIFIVPFEEGQLEVAVFRKEGSYSDGRHPDHVEPGTPQEDAQRRDFTINSLFFDLKIKKVIDYFDGQEDIKNKVIRTVGEAKRRFQEDHLRVLRAIRFATQLDFLIEEKTFQEIVKWGVLKDKTKIEEDGKRFFYKNFRPSSLSKERIKTEIENIFLSSNRLKGLYLLQQTNLINWILTEDISRFPSYYEEITRLKWIFGQLPKKTPLDFAWAYFCDMLCVCKQINYSPDSTDLKESLESNLSLDEKFNENKIETICLCVDQMDQSVGFLKKQKNNIKEILVNCLYLNQKISEKKWGEGLNILAQTYSSDWNNEDYLKFCQLKNKSFHLFYPKQEIVLVKEFETLLNKFSQISTRGNLPKPWMTGKDLLKEGFTEGRDMGEKLQMIYEKQLEKQLSGKWKTKSDLLEWLEEQKKINK